MGIFSDDMSDRFMVFVVNIIKLEKQLCKTYSGRHIYGQLFRAGLNQDKRQSTFAEATVDEESKKTKVKNKIQNSKFKIQSLAAPSSPAEVGSVQCFSVSEFQSFSVER